jgi:opacity protein-like surface antigen
MTYKKLLASTALAGLLATSNAFSQTTNFVGPSLALSGAYVGGSSNVNTGENLNNFVNGLGLNAKLGDQTNVIPGIDLNYGFALGNNFVLGIGAAYDFSKTKTGGFNFNGYIYGEDSTITLDSELKNHYSLYVQPTYVINKDSAFFAKVGRHYAKSEVSSTGTGSFYAGAFGDSPRKNNVEGWGYGLGLKTFLNSNFYVQAEAGIVEYDRVNLPFNFEGLNYDDINEDGEPTSSSIKQKTTNATISVGYKF